jgi:ferredoxin-NADP reductase
MTASLPDPMLPQPYRVCRVQPETHDTFTLDLEPKNGSPAARFAAGQFNMLGRQQGLCHRTFLAVTEH